MRRRLWIAFGTSMLVHLAVSSWLLLRRDSWPTLIADAPIEVELLPPIASEPLPPPAPPDEAPAAARPSGVARSPGGRPPAPGGATSPSAPAQPTAEAAPVSTPEATPGDRFTTFRQRHLALGPKPPPPPPGPRAGSLESIFNPAPDVLHHKTTESAVGVKRPGNGVEGRVTPDGRIAFKDPGSVRYMGLGLGFDITDAVLRAIGDDPYSATKAKIAEATREERFCLTLEDLKGNKRDALFHLKGNLERIAADSTLTLAERRAAVFELWEGCFESDDGLAQAARATIVAFIRRAFPSGTPKAYTPVELAMLNRDRNCTRPFDPYTDRRPDAGADPR